MKRPLLSAVVTAVVAVTLGVIPAHATSAVGETSAPTAADPIDPTLREHVSAGGTVRVNVVTENQTDLAGAAAAGEALQTLQTLPVATLRVDRAGLDRLAAQPGVVSVTEDVLVPPSLDSSVPLIGADKTAAAGLTGAGSAVAVLDTGVAVKHPFLGNRVIAEACFSPVEPTRSATSLCPNGTERQEGPGTADAERGPCATIVGCDHGTHVAGIAAGNGQGVAGAPRAGVAPGAGIIALQVFSKVDSEEFCGVGEAPCVGSFTSAQLAGLEKLLQLRQAGTPVVAANLSLGGGRFTSACDQDPRKLAIDQLFAAGVATVVAAGNNGYTDAVSAPGCVSSAITVGSTSDDDQLSAFTNRGPLVDVLAPGTDIVSSVPGGGFAAKNGTSMAAPHVTGALAVLRQAHPGTSLADLEKILKSTGKTITYTGASTPRIQLGQAPPIRPRAIVTPADVTGDGRADLVIQETDGNITVRTAKAASSGTPARRFNDGVHWSAGWSNYLGEPGKGRLYFADANNDGKADLIVHSPNGVIAVRINRGTYWDGGTDWSTGWSNYLGEPGKGKLYFADANNDGKADLIVHSPNGVIAVRINRGTYWDGGTDWSTGWSNYLGEPGKGKLYFADANNDGKADLIVHSPNGVIAVRINRGTYWDGGTDWSTGWSNYLGEPGKGKLYFADVTGDGKADLIVHDADGRIGTRTNTGTHFAVSPGDDWI